MIIYYKLSLHSNYYSVILHSKLKTYIMSKTKRLLEELNQNLKTNKLGLGKEHWNAVIRDVERLDAAEEEFYHQQQLNEELKMSKS